MKADELDKKFDDGEDISQFLDISKARRPQQDQKRVNVDFPVWMIQQLDKEARRLGVENGFKYVDEYYEKNRPVSKSVVLSYLNSMSYEIGNLKSTFSGGSLNEEAKKALQANIGKLEKKYGEYNRDVNDFDSITVEKLNTDTQIDIKTSRIEAYKNAAGSYYYPGLPGVIVDPNNPSFYTVIEATNYIFTFSASVSNTGSKADVAIHLNGLNNNGIPVASHIMKTSVGTEYGKNVGDRIVLPRGNAQDISKWEIADIKITRNRTKSNI